MQSAASPLPGAGRVAVLFCILLAIRIAVALVIDGTFDVAKEGDLYPIAARSIVAGDGFTAEGEDILWRAPLYPYFLAGVFKVFGDTNYLAVLIANSVLDAMTALLIWWLGQRLFSRPVGVVAAVLFTLHPFSAYYTIRVMAEPLFTLAFTATVAALVAAWSKPLRPKAFLFVGALAAVTALIKPVLVAFTPFVAVLLFVWHYRRPLTALPSAAAVILAFVVVLAPWTARNYSLTGQIIPVATAGGYTFWLGNNQATGGREYHELADDPVALARYSEEQFDILASVYGESAEIAEVTIINGQRIWTPPNIGQVEDAAFLRAGLQGAFESPVGAASLVFKKLVRFWYSIYMPENRWAQTYISVIQAVFMLVVVIGIISALRAGLLIVPLLVAIAYLNLMHSATFATLRYSMPLVPILMLFATYAVIQLGSRLAARVGLSPPSLQPTTAQGR